MSARTRELFGLVPVTLLVTAGFSAVLLTRTTEIHSLTVTYGLVFLGLCLFAHLFIRARLPDADPYMFPLAALLAAVGLVMLYRIEEDLARDQAGVFILGLVLFVVTIVALRDHRRLERYRYTIAAASIVLLFLPSIPFIGEETNGARLAVKAPLIGSFQPAEFAKVGIVIFLASYLSDVRDVLVTGRLPRLSMRHFGPLLVVWGAAMLMLLLIRDLGTSLMFFGGFLALLYVATSRASLVLVGFVMFALGAWLIGSGIEHVQERVDIWLDPFRPGVVDREGYQIAQSLFAQADGGLFGQGFGQALLALPSGQRILPAAHTDLIYALITDELGLLGAVAVVMACLLFAERGFKTAMLATDGFGKLLAAGLTAVFALQVFVIVGGVTRVIPLTGVTLPFISFGGSSIVANMILLALLLVVSDHARRDRRRTQGGVV